MQEPINDPELAIVQLPTKICSVNEKANQNMPEYNYDLIVFVKSCSFCFADRNHSRETYMNPKIWGDFKVGFVFVVGAPIQTESRQFIFGKIRITMPNLHWPFKGMKINDTRLSGMKLLLDEAQKHGDMLIGSFEDTYYNLTLKQMLAFRWAAAFCRQQTDLYLFIDHDHALIPQNTKRFVRRFPKQRRPHVAGGHVYREYSVVRQYHKKEFYKWSVTEDEVPFKHYPPFMSGFYGYVLGSELVKKLAIATAFTQFLRLEDAFLGIILYKLDVVVMNFNEFGYENLNDATIRHAVTGPTDQIDRLIDWHTGRSKKQNLF